MSVYLTHAEIEAQIQGALSAARVPAIKIDLSETEIIVTCTMPNMTDTQNEIAQAIMDVLNVGYFPVSELTDTAKSAETGMSEYTFARS